MSFTSDVRDELCLCEAQNGCCAVSEAAAIMCFSAVVGADKTISVKSENKNVTEKLSRLIFDIFSVKVNLEEPKKEGGMFLLSIPPEHFDRICKGLEISWNNEAFSVNEEVFESQCCKAAFIRGAFLGGGSVSDPEKGYHLEFVTKGAAGADRLCEVLALSNINAKLIVRKNYFVVYVKESESIAEALGFSGAGLSMMNFLNVKIEREVRNRVNREMNCDEANLEKMMSASKKHIDAIKLIMDTVGLDALSEPLMDMALLRLSNPEATISELGRLSNPPIGKSGANHRLEKLVQIADSLKI